MKHFIPNRELDELGTGVVLTYIKKSGIAGLPRCVNIEGIANSMGLNVVYETYAEDDYDKIGFLSDGITPLKVKRGNKIVPFLFPLGTIVVELIFERKQKAGNAALPSRTRWHISLLIATIQCPSSSGPSTRNGSIR